MQITRIPKKNGKFRTIYAPNPEEKEGYRKLITELMPLAYQLCDPGVVHGFMPGKSPITNALSHINKEFTLCMDMQDFFDTVTWRNLQGLLPDDMIEQVLYDGSARQGLPTSPIVSNICASPMDTQIKDEIPAEVTYTRYADDLCFSFNTKGLAKELIATAITAMEARRFKLNKKKTRLQWAGAGRRIITGVAVEGDSIYPTRRVKRKYRAACHQQHKGSMHGLREWMRQRPPAQYKEAMAAEFDKLKKLLIMFNGHELPDSHGYEKTARSIYLE